MAEIETRVELLIPSPQKLFTPAVTVILILMVAGFALFNYARDFTVANLMLTTTGVFGGKIWQLFTYPFIECNLLILIFDMFLTLFVGSNVEREWRTGGIIFLWLTVSVICGVVWLLFNRLTGFNYPGFGAAACEFGLIGVFGILFYRRRFIAWFWVMQAQHACWGLIIIGIIFSIPQPITFLWLSGAVVGFLYVKIRKRLIFGRGFAHGAKIRPGSFVDID